MELSVTFAFLKIDERNRALALFVSLYEVLHVRAHIDLKKLNFRVLKGRTKI